MICIQLVGFVKEEITDSLHWTDAVRNRLRSLEVEDSLNLRDVVDWVLVWDSGLAAHVRTTVGYSRGSIS